MASLKIAARVEENRIEYEVVERLLGREVCAWMFEHSLLGTIERPTRTKLGGRIRDQRYLQRDAIAGGYDQIRRVAAALPPTL